jgi:hypothetical protein
MHLYGSILPGTAVGKTVKEVKKPIEGTWKVGGFYRYLESEND